MLLEAGGEYPNGARTLEIAAIARAKIRTHLPIVVDVASIAQRARYSTAVACAANRRWRRRRHSKNLGWPRGRCAASAGDLALGRGRRARRALARNRRRCAQMKQIAVFGFGLVGASLAAAVRQAKPEIRLVAVDLPEVVASSAAQRLADELVDHADRARVLAAVEGSDLCVLAAPISMIVAELPGLLERASAVTDCGSTKRSIWNAALASARRGRFVPGHPMAGGPEVARRMPRSDLFRGQTWLLCPEQSDADAVACVETLIALVGARSVHLSVEAHDRAVAFTSHGPQILASALAVLATRAGAELAAGPAYRGTTRSAGGAQSMWRDTFSSNADEVSIVLRQLIVELNSVATGLEALPADPSAALALLAEARARRDR